MKFWAKVLVIWCIVTWAFIGGMYIPLKAADYRLELADATADWLSRETEMLSPNELAHGKLKWIKVTLSKKEAYRRYKKRLQDLHEKYAFLFK